MDKDEAKRIFGENLKRLRIARGMSQDELAKALGYTNRSSINKIELGKNDMPRNKIVRAAAVLGISPLELFGYEELSAEETSVPTEEERLKKLGEHIRLLRESEGMSQEELAKKSGFAGRAAISAIEKGKNNISIEKLPDLALALHTTPGELMDVLIETEEKPITHGLNAESIAKLKSYADYLRANQGD